MKKGFITITLLTSSVFTSWAQSKLMQITTIESTVSGGSGRSRIIITDENGKQSEENLINLFSMVGLNFKNIKDNEETIVSKLQNYTDKGWKIISVTPLTISPAQGGGNVGLFMTRYLLSKESNQ
jgi:hypothetical protein